jgi:hypothetical protein
VPLVVVDPRLLRQGDETRHAPHLPRHVAAEIGETPDARRRILGGWGQAIGFRAAATTRPA